jgi:hypothetical protein
MKTFVFSQSVTTYDIFQIEADSKEDAEAVLKNSVDPQQFFTGESNDVTRGEFVYEDEKCEV